MTSNGPFMIVVGVDGSIHSQKALKWALDEAGRRDGGLRLITAWSKPPMSWYPAVLETAVGEIVAEDSPERIAETVQADALRTAAGEGISATGQVVHNDSAASAILDAAKDADLIIVGSRGHGGFPGLHLGSVSTQVINHAPCPVLVVR
ncbi:universal stress protein UspA [Arthrobacter sp. SRS-W-1-2016]|jgi:nucleotide-binding universal stress UspA family protein|uniref:universal stress protein n=1 Tax=Arthrobacter TaxID=1663 RepID=UPI000990BDC8|nr:MULTISPECIES: universal stress protein [Arthrobacter]MDQ0210427.1 nucleotide-binding universal stress UspA family protein [Arthrobacter bambusae]MDQ0234876.1 nucleotide-binding universal stress UspA family protein [Arthrobacter bambusae]OOP65077.1 universal stress protein UspA [Arthrobacter sp. SRS-W-1-2016]